MSPLDPARITRSVVENQEDGRLSADADTALSSPSAMEPASGLHPDGLQSAGASDRLELEWRDGAPPKPWSQEWFIALTTYGDRVVLRALPEEYAYDFKTADETYIKRERIAKWMQFPDSQYIAPPAKAETMRRALASFPRDVVEVLNALGDGEYVQSAFYVSGEIGVPEKRVLAIHRALRTLGFAGFGTLTREDDGAMVGSGYWVSSQGACLASGIEAATADETALAGSAEGESPVAKPDAQEAQP